MRGKTMLYVDQYGTRIYAKTVRELRAQVDMGGGRVFKIYRDLKDGRTVHVGYGVGNRWFDAFAPVQLPAR